MYIPDSGIAAKALAGLDQPRRDFANHFADRISLLPVESLHDDKRIRTELLLELQSRFTPEEAARISYTSSDILVSIALSIVRDRHESVEKAKRLSLIINVIIGLLVSVAIIAIYMFFSQEAPKPLRAEAKAETRVAPATK
jgi:sensor c-di-GMP phosphodiesterase-like protein